MKWVTALIALSLIFLFSDVIYSAKLEGKIFPSFFKTFFPSSRPAGNDCCGLRNKDLSWFFMSIGSHFLKGFAQFSSLNLSSKEV